MPLGKFSMKRYCYWVKNNGKKKSSRSYKSHYDYVFPAVPINTTYGYRLWQYNYKLHKKNSAYVDVLLIICCS